MKIKSTTAAIITIVLILGGVGIAKLTGTWITESTKVPRKISAGEFAGFSDPADIRGSYSFQNISDNFSIPAEDLAQAFALDTSEKDAGEYLAKDLEAIYGDIIEGEGEVGTDSIRWFVALYMGYPYTPEETTRLPAPALSLLMSRGLIDDDQLQLVKSAVISPAAGTTFTRDPDAEHLESSEDFKGSSDSRFIRGRTTFADLYSWGVTKEEIEEATGVKAGARSAIIRDYYAGLDLEFSTMKTVLQELVDSKPTDL